PAADVPAQGVLRDPRKGHRPLSRSRRGRLRNRAEELVGPGTMLTLVLVVVLTALVFEYINGFHDTANSIATVVATKVLSPMQAVGLAASMNLVGALAGTAVAKTISSGLIDAGVVEVGSQLILCALLGGITWNLITWWFGLPSSSSHALIGGLLGAA